MIIGILSPIYLFYLPSVQPLTNNSLFGKARRIDWLGMVLNAAIYTCSVLALTLGGTIWPWNDNRTITVFAILGVALIAYTTTQYVSLFTSPEHRMFPGEVFRSRSIVLLLLCTNAASAALFTIVFYVPVYYQFTREDNGLESASHLALFVPMVITWMLISHLWISRSGYYMPWYSVGGGLITVGGGE